MQIIDRKVSELKAYGKNPRKNDPAVQAVANSISEFGFKVPIIIDRDDVIVAGHTRLKAAKLLGLKTVPCIVADDLTPEQVKAFRLADNKSGEIATWDDSLLDEELKSILDIDMSQFGFDPLKELDEDAHAVKEETEDKVPDTPETPFTKKGDLWILGKHRLLCGDCTNEKHVKLLLGDDTPELLLTDPPYCSGGFQESGKSAGSIGSVQGAKIKLANDLLSTRGYQHLIERMFANTNFCSAVYCFTDWRMWVNLYDLIEGAGYGVRSMIVWNKQYPGLGVGWRSQHELIAFGTKITPKWNKHNSFGNVITLSRTKNELHPTQKPVELIETLLENSNWVKGVYDPFGGSGTTLIACEKKGQRCWTIELAENYCDKIVKRYVQATGDQKSVKLIRDGKELKGKALSPLV